jgi:hypothetical protein
MTNTPTPQISLYRTESGEISFVVNDAALKLPEEEFFAFLDDCITTLKTHAISVEQS